MQFTKRTIAMTAAYGFLALAGLGGANPASAAVSIYVGVAANGFGARIEDNASLAEAKNTAQAGCASTPGNTCVEVVSCTDGGYASVAYKFSPITVAGVCGFSTQAAADQAAMAKCGSGCSQGDQYFDKTSPLSAAASASQCGSYGSPNSGCTTSTATTPTTPDTPTTPNATDAANIPRVFNWAEATYPQFFAPSGQTCQDGFGYRYRYYSQSQSYLAAKDGRVYVLIPALGKDILDVGTLDDLLVNAKAAGF